MAERESGKWGCRGSNYDGEGNTVQYHRPVLSAVIWPSFIRNVRAQRIEHNDFVRGASSQSNPGSKQCGTDSAVTLKGQKSRIDPERWRQYLAEDHIIYLFVRYL